MKKHLVHLRFCLIKREYFPKSELFRIYIDKNNNVGIDLDGKNIGRGAYLSKDEEVILKAKKRKILNKALRSNVKNEIYDTLLQLLKERR